MGRIIARNLNGCDGGITEIDAASHGSVEDARELVVQARTFPNGYKYKVYIIDECHAASTNYWQSMLKVLEESPAKSVFCFCTTNPEKIPATILSRVQTFQLSKISLEGIYSRLVEVIKKENEEGNTITYEDDAIRFLAKLANGGMRDALTLLDKALVYNNNITSANLELSLGLPKYDDFFALLSAISKKDNESVINTVYKVYNSGVNFVKWFEDFHSFVINIVKYIFIKDINRTMIPTHYEDKISKYSTAHCSICLRLANLLMKMNGELKTSSYQQDLVLTYLCKLPKA
jgi:DNA polymerase-3 subunit gamma/tau